MFVSSQPFIPIHFQYSLFVFNSLFFMYLYFIYTLSASPMFVSSQTFIPIHFQYSIFVFNSLFFMYLYFIYTLRQCLCPHKHLFRFISSTHFLFLTHYFSCIYILSTLSRLIVCGDTNEGGMKRNFPPLLVYPCASMSQALPTTIPSSKVKFTTKLIFASLTQSQNTVAFPNL